MVFFIVEDPAKELDVSCLVALLQEPLLTSSFRVSVIFASIVENRLLDGSLTALFIVVRSIVSCDCK